MASVETHERGLFGSVELIPSDGCLGAVSVRPERERRSFPKDFTAAASGHPRLSPIRASIP